MWQLKPGQQQFMFDAVDLANLFVNATRFWYVEPSNSLYQRKDEVFKVVHDYLKTGQEPEGLEYSLLYALTKFQTEWLGEAGNSGMFVKG